MRSAGREQILGLALIVVSVALLNGCGPGKYGFARFYEPTNEERPFDQQGKDIPYGAVAANPDDFEGQLIAWFGIVQKAALANDGRYLVRLSHNTHKERHLCADDTNSSCRVTVHFKSSGGFSVLLALQPEDLVPGLDKIQPGTLLRVFGRVRCRAGESTKKICDYDEQGGILLEGVYYRQWPARYYVTTRWASSMRR